MDTPIIYTWDGAAMVPHPRFARACEQFTTGENYRLVVHEERSTNTHRHYFAAIHDAWMNLPDDIAMDFPNAEYLRKWALIQAGYAHERAISCRDRQEARKIAAFIKPMDEYAVVIVRDATIKVYTALSQSVKAMTKQEFQASKVAVLDVVSKLIGVSPAALAANTGKAA